MVKILETYFDCEDDSKSKMAIFTSDLPDPVLEMQFIRRMSPKLVPKL
jgi:hypothetical protein